MGAPPFQFTRRRVTIAFDLSDTSQLSAEDAAKALQASFDGAQGGYAYQPIYKAVLDAFYAGNGVTSQAVKCMVSVENL